MNEKWISAIFLCCLNVIPLVCVNHHWWTKLS